METKNVSLAKLLSQEHCQFTLPADRINKFLDMLIIDFSEMSQEQNSLKDYFIEEIKFAKNAINSRSLYKSENTQLMKRIEKQKSKLIQQNSALQNKKFGFDQAIEHDA